MRFEEAEALFRADRISELAEDPGGLRYLKLRCLSRREHLQQLFEAVSLRTDIPRARDMFRQAYNSAVDAASIDAITRRIYDLERAQRRQREPELVSELYQLQVFDWGGLHQNSLEKTIVDNYVKRIQSYSTLCDRIENELHDSMRGYVLCSWYNHWTSIIIEDAFRDHESVLPAVGLVKKIDFFLQDVPFDLKVTYLPEGLIAKSRRADGLRPELTLLRHAARREGLHFDDRLSSAKLLEDLWAKLRDHPSSEAQALVAELTEYRLNLLRRFQENCLPLIRWLYENQGVRRFDASNRLFLVLVDPSNFFESWKLKRANPLLDVQIRSFLDGVGESPGREVEFEWEGTTFRARSDVVFVVHPQT